ncbi:MAG: thioredoxin domain-containing protein, partial [Nitrososphaerales archaeon]
SLTGSGGWPLSVFLTPDLEPFYGGTYFPPVSRYGMSGFSMILRSISQAWESDRAKIIDSASHIRLALKEMYSTGKKSDAKIDDHVMDDCYNILAQEYDREYGGFGSAPKFPTPSNLLFLMRYHSKIKEKAPLQMVTKTLDSMASGGIYDHIGGGFHRYSTDREWLVPHFEKMLYDNALLSLAYTEAYQITKKESYRTVVEETLFWVLSEMSSKGGGFFSAQDADSPEGEGSYYVWNKKDVEEALVGSELGKDYVDLLCRYFSITERGNFEGGKSILTSPRDSNQLPASEEISKARTAMLDFRAKRLRPFTDDKILTGWNGLMISAMSRAYRVFGKKEFIDSAIKTSDFILDNLTITDGNAIKLIRRFREGEAKGNPVLEDYAFFINSLVDLYEASFEPKYLEYAVKLCNQMINDFYEQKAGGFFMNPRGSEDLIARAKDANDGALPSANSVAALVLLRLAELTSNEDYRKKAEGTMVAFWASIEEHPASHAFMLVALDFMLGKAKEIVISGERDSPQLKDLVRTVYGQYLPNSVIALADERVSGFVPMIDGRLSSPGQKPRIFVCSNYSCKLPSTTREELLAALNS